VYGVTKGSILEDIGRRDVDTELYDRALAAYVESGRNAEQARGKGSAEAGHDLWYSLMRIGSVQFLLLQSQNTLATFPKGTPLAGERAKNRKDIRPRLDLAYNYELIGDTLDVQGDDLEADQGKRAQARNSWSRALTSLRKSEQLLEVLAQ